MSRARTYSLLLVIAGALLFAPSLIAAAGVEGNLVKVNWLQEHLKDASVLILDASPAQVYAEKHIPGAVSVDIYLYGVSDAPVAETEQRLQSWGLSPGRKVVLYDQGGNMTATRVFFALAYCGYPVRDLLVLDGGLARWQEQGLAVTKEVPPVAKGSFKIGKLNDDIRVRLPEFLNASGDTANNALIEALTPKWHFGEQIVFNKGGHIPNGILLPSADFYNADKTFKSADEIRRMLDYVGISRDQHIYTYCGGGVAASVPFFAVKYIAGYPNVKLYSESEMGWLSDERELPYWTYDSPFLMRDAQWLQWQNNQMIRTYLGAKVSIIDVRSSEAFNQGHMPFALNIPAEVFKANLATPDNLARILGPAGVDVSHEAVVISGAGITKDAALAFVMLEKIGQKKVSLFTDSLDQWTKLGYPLKKDATLVAAKKGPHDPTIPPTTYPASTGRDVLIGDVKSTHGLYPKVFIASGKELPARTENGKVVHVPYTDLLNADGTPKAAKDVWNILWAAGVPRYAELVCVSDDPAEAAANYFVLKLMGYPDVKVLVM